MGSCFSPFLGLPKLPNALFRDSKFYISLSFRGGKIGKYFLGWPICPNTTKADRITYQPFLLLFISNFAMVAVKLIYQIRKIVKNP